MPDDDDFVLSGLDDDIGSVPEGDSGILESSGGGWNGLKFVKNGCCTIVKFNSVDVPDEVCIALYRDQVYELLNDPACELLRFDLTGIPFLPSGMLGLLTSVKKRGINVEVTNASQNICDSLRISRLDRLITVCD